MEELGFDITKEYHDLYTFDSKKVKCVGVIKDLVESLTYLPMNSLVMDIVVADIPPHFGRFFYQDHGQANWEEHSKWT